MRGGRIVRVGPVELGGHFAFIAGPCVIEDADRTLRIAEALREICANLDVPLVFKASFDKANRTSASSFRGIGMDAGLRVLESVRREVGVPVTTDVHDVGQVCAVSGVVDLLQVPAFLCRQTDLLLACAASGRPVNVKKGQFLAPWAMEHVIAKARGEGGVLVTERGTSFGHGDLVVDMRGIPIMKGFGVPVVFDATHSVQRPGRDGARSGGQRAWVGPLARAAIAAGADALFAEVHDDPSSALSDPDTQLPLEAVEPLLRSVARWAR